MKFISRQFFSWHNVKQKCISMKLLTCVYYIFFFSVIIDSKNLQSTLKLLFTIVDYTDYSIIIVILELGSFVTCVRKLL